MSLPHLGKTYDKKRFGALLKNLCLPSEKTNPHLIHLEKVWDQFPELNSPPASGKKESILTWIADREKIIIRTLSGYYQDTLSRLAADSLESPHSFILLHGQTHLVDGLLFFTLRAVLSEVPWLVGLRILDGQADLAFKTKLLPEKIEKRAHLESNLPLILEEEGDTPEQRAYFQKIMEGQEKEIRQVSQSVQKLEAEIPLLKNFPAGDRFIHSRLALFARGGYGRGELSLGSDLDTGYCLDTTGLQPGHVEVFKEMISRMESLLKGAGIHTVSQYFELGEDLSRFAQLETIHTVPAILESRLIAGPPFILANLKAQFKKMMPFELFLKQKMTDFERQPMPSHTSMNLKEDFGGLRTIQIPLWIMAVQENSKKYYLGDLIALAVKKNLLSVWEASTLALGLEFLYDLRNFVSGAKRYFYTREAQDALYLDPHFPPNRINDSLERLYLYKKHRFKTMDQFDTYRLRLVADVQRIAKALLDRVLDRTMSHSFGDLKVWVHLGSRQITRLETTKGAPLFSGAKGFNGEGLLELFCYIAQTDFDLTPGIKDSLASVVTGMEVKGDQGGVFQYLDRMMLAPYSHRAVETLFEISDPLSPGMETLMGRLIPECDKVFYLLRDMDRVPHPVHRMMILALKSGQDALTEFRENYPEWWGTLTPLHKKGLKWALFLHPIGKVKSMVDNPAASAELACDILNRIGNSDEELENLVRNMIQHQSSLLALSKTSTYFDHALTDYFELSGRKIENMLLLFLVNYSILLADGEVQKDNQPPLRNLFEEATRILAELRGLPVEGKSREYINTYLMRKKQELEADTRYCLLLHKSLAQGLDASVFSPLKQVNPAESKRMEGRVGDMETWLRALLRGGEPTETLFGLEEKLIQTFRQYISTPTLAILTHEDEQTFSWFFSAFPNRYLLRQDPRALASQVIKFNGFQHQPVLVDAIAGSQGMVETLLIHTRDIPRSHDRVAYAISLKHLDIQEGKINKVILPGGVRGYCYYFQVHPLALGDAVLPRDLEALIRDQSPPEPDMTHPQNKLVKTSTQVEFLGNDGKGYHIVSTDGGYDRQAGPYHVIKMELKDEPFILYKAIRIFSRYDAEIQQSLITTTGNLVQDYFYLNPDDYQRLKGSDFEERFISLMHTASF
ncbi:MAG: hypothetical protein OEW12_00840 [Deltaproteobacteria bacterium]|nr:hypothetical protein [Deltaproteobacteria bacterium]